MKAAALLLVVIAFSTTLFGQESSYRNELKSAHARLRALEEQRNEFRRNKRDVPADLDKARFLLLGQLQSNDPLWVLTRQIETDIAAIAALPQQTPEDETALSTLKDFLAVISGLGEAASLSEAETLATTLRQFAARRDGAGAVAWAKRK